MINVDFKQLAIFAKLAEEKHFARTAEYFHLTPSTITRSIQRLESELGCLLLIRNNRQVELTPAGKKLAAFADDILAGWQQLSWQIQENNSMQVTGELNIYSSVTASYSILSPILDRFRLVYPDVEIRLHTGDQAQAIEHAKSGNNDIVVAAKPRHIPASMQFKTLTYSPLRFIMSSSHSYVVSLVNDQIKRLDVIDPATLPMIVADKGVAREHFQEWLKLNHLNANIYAQVSGHEAIVSMVALGCGIGLVPEVVVQHSPFRDKITLIDAAPALAGFQIGLCALKGRLQLPQVKCFWDIATELFLQKENSL